ncbi:MAG: sugar kinase [Sulfobacillus acidophilus]|uniref:Sugar kinase n=1 Tax=Sulfobacillus acidophilus TaxID=53633 RepID=A0A2T2WKF5_9FIRM|nr:MAG: sugar kinase [Sulfobacillus acidophilus]
MTWLAGIDIGGTKCAVAMAEYVQGRIQIKARDQIETPSVWSSALEDLDARLKYLIRTTGSYPEAIGISSGGPLDPYRGMILSPPNLPGWNDVPIVDYFLTRYRVPTALENDANAGAVAELRWGAYGHVKDLVFLTFGTGMGAGLIVNGQIVRGATAGAGEIGHIRLATNGPMGYGKAGSFEGFCSGGGIAQLALQRLADTVKQGLSLSPVWTQWWRNPSSLTAEAVGQIASQGDELAIQLLKEVGEWLGRGISILIDLLNPEVIVIGSIFARQRRLLEGPMHRILEVEALPENYRACRIVSSSFGEQVGDFAAFATAVESLEVQANNVTVCERNSTQP